MSSLFPEANVCLRWTVPSPRLYLTVTTSRLRYYLAAFSGHLQFQNKVWSHTDQEDRGGGRPAMTCSCCQDGKSKDDGGGRATLSRGLCQHVALTGPESIWWRLSFQFAFCGKESLRQCWGNWDITERGQEAIFPHLHVPISPPEVGGCACALSPSGFWHRGHRAPVSSACVRRRCCPVTR